VADLPDPVAPAGRAGVDVCYAAVNYPDLLIFENKYQFSIAPPFVPGSEFSGVVVAMSDGADGVAVGDRVSGSSMTGAFAERVTVPGRAVRRVPDGVGLDAVAGFWVAHATAYHALRSIAQVIAGECLVVLGATGGVGAGRRRVGDDPGAGDRLRFERRESWPAVASASPS
jgi:NADPH2:quinone reductase